MIDDNLIDLLKQIEVCMMQSQYIYQGTSSIRSKEKFAINIAFFLLFPGFFFYQTLLGIGMISAFMGGYFSIASVALLLPLISFYLIRIKQHKNYFQKTDLYFLIYLIYFFFIVAINFSAGANETIVVHHVLSIVYAINDFIIFKMIDLNDKKFRATAILSLMVMSAIVFYFSVDGFFFLASLGESKNPESVASYQGFASSYLLTFVVVISFARPALARILIYCLTIPALFLNGARSEFVAMLFLIPIIEIYHARHKLPMVLAFSSALAITYFNFNYISMRLPNNRILELLDLSQSTSANARHHLTEQALKTISENPIFGDYASYNVGEYSHNILSAWVDLGLFGFIYLLLILLMPAFRLGIHGFFLKGKYSNFLLAYSLICISLLLLFTSKTFSDMVTGAALGAYASYRYGKKI